MFIQEHRHEFKLEIMCQVLEVNKSGYYAWLKRAESNRSKERKILTEKIKTEYATSRNTYGSTRIRACLLEQNVLCSRPRMASIMRENGIKSKRKGKIKHQTTNSKHQNAIAENKLERNFNAEKPDQKWASDITYIPTLEGWLYLAVVLDLFSRKRPCPLAFPPVSVPAR